MTNLRYTMAGIAMVILAITAINLSGLWDIDGGSRDFIAPDPGDPALVAAGGPLYIQHCSECHGRNLEGQPNWQKLRDDGTRPAPPHDVSGHTWHHSDDLLTEITAKGGQIYMRKGETSGMPGFEAVITAREIAAVLAYIKSRWPPAALERQQMITRREKG